MPVVPVLVVPQRPMQQVTPPAVPAVLRIVEPVVQALAVQRLLPRLRAVQDLSVVPRIAAPAVRQVVVPVVPAE